MAVRAEHGALIAPALAGQCSPEFPVTLNVSAERLSGAVAVAAPSPSLELEPLPERAREAEAAPAPRREAAVRRATGATEWASQEQIAGQALARRAAGMRLPGEGYGEAGREGGDGRVEGSAPAARSLGSGHCPRCGHEAQKPG